MVSLDPVISGSLHISVVVFVFFFRFSLLLFVFSFFRCSLQIYYFFIYYRIFSLLIDLTGYTKSYASAWLCMQPPLSQIKLLLLL